MLNFHFQGSSRWRFVSSCHVNWDSVTSGLGARHIYFRYNATSGNIVDNTIELLDLENMNVALGISVTAVTQTKTAFTYGLDGRHMYFWYNATSGCVGDNVVKPGNIETMEVGVGILFLAVLCAEIVLLPVWATAISISGITRLPVISSTTPLNSWSSETWVWVLKFCP